MDQQPSPAKSPGNGSGPAKDTVSAKDTVPAKGPVDAAQAAAIAAASRSTRLTGRAAVLAVVICAIALSLAYPVREYIAQRQQIDQLLAQQQVTSAQVKALQQQAAALGQPSYVEQRAREDLHMCFPDEQCYEVIDGQPPATVPASKRAVNPWYAKLWQSVQRANQEPAR